MMFNQPTVTKVRRFGVILVLGMSLLSGLSAQQPVVIGGYDFPPYLNVSNDQPVSGITLELIAQLNLMQDEYQFELFLTSPARRFDDFSTGLFDMMLFENPIWGWEQMDMYSTALPLFFDDREVYIARQELGRTQTYFNDLTQRRMAGIFSYHYAFADYVNDADWLRDNFNMVLVNSQDALVELVVQGRADVAVVSEAYLLAAFTQNPLLRSQILVSEKIDQEYQHHIIARSAHSATAQAVHAWLQQVSQSSNPAVQVSP